MGILGKYSKFEQVLEKWAFFYPASFYSPRIFTEFNLQATYHDLSAGGSFTAAEFKPLKSESPFLARKGGSALLGA